MLRDFQGDWTIRCPFPFTHKRHRQCPVGFPTASAVPTATLSRYRVIFVGVRDSRFPGYSARLLGRSFARSSADGLGASPMLTSLSTRPLATSLLRPFPVHFRATRFGLALSTIMPIGSIATPNSDIRSDMGRKPPIQAETLLVLRGGEGV